MTDSDNKLFINGPINVVRLEGTVFGVKKVLYVFMDHHVNIHYQTQCEDINSIDVNKYFLNIKNDKQPIDFFFEITSRNINDEKKYFKYRQRYIEEVSKLFIHKFKINNKQKHVTNSINVRLHFLDYRDMLKDDEMFSIIETLINITDSFFVSQSINYERITTVTELLKELSKVANSAVDNIFKKDANVPKDILKIMNKYNHKEVHNNFKPMFENIKNLQKNLNTEIEDLLKLIEENDVKIKQPSNGINFSYMPNNIIRYGIDPNYLRSYISTLRNCVDDIYASQVDIFFRITDLFFLRRFLDKNYITNAIVYTGHDHSTNYVQHLVTVYDFKITHFSYSAITDIDKLNKTIKKFNDPTDFTGIQKILLPPELYQCSDLSNFPKDFS